MAVSNKSSNFSLKSFNQIHLKKKLIIAAFTCYILFLYSLSLCNISSLQLPLPVLLVRCDSLSENQLKCQTSPSSCVFCHILIQVLGMDAHLLVKYYISSPRNFSCYGDAKSRNRNLLVKKFFFHRR